jgi:multidrug efflux pump subunit AcrB
MVYRMKTLTRAAVAWLLLSVSGICLGGCTRASVESPQHAIVVEAHYPGASARVVADTLAVPIEQQINGIEKMLSMRSRSGDDGLCTITVTFTPGVDPSAAQTLVQNRVSLALPILPDLVQRAGVTVKKRSAGVCLILFLSSPNGTFDNLYLSNYANIQVRDELARAAGVAEVVLLGSQDYSLRIWLDPDRLAALGLAATDVAKAIEQHNLQPAAAPTEADPGKSTGFSMTVKSLGRLATVEELNDLMVKADAAGRDIRLRDVAKVEIGATRADSQARLDGKPGVAMAIHLLPLARPRDVSAAVQQMMTRLAGRLPEGINLDVAFDFTANLEAAGRATSPEYVLLDMDAPPGASAARRLAILDRADAVMRLGKEMERVLSVTENVFDRVADRPCLLVRVAAAGQRQAAMDAVAEAIRGQLQKQVAEAAFRLRDLSRPNAFPRCGYPIDLAVQGSESQPTRSFTRKLAERLRESNKLTDVWTDAEAADRSQVQLDIDANAAKALGVALPDIRNTLQVFFGGLELQGSGGTWQVKLQAGTELRKNADDMMQLKVRNAKGDMVPLSRLVTLRELTGACALERLNGKPMVEITANPAAGASVAEIRTLCETLAKEVRAELRLPDEYRISWLHDTAAAN